MVIGANPTDAHPVFASRMKKRLREGAKLIVVDPRRIDLVRIAACRGRLSSAAAPGTNVAVLNALAHVIVTEGLVNEAFVRERCDWDEFQDWAPSSEPRNSPRRPRNHRRAGRRSARRGAALRHRRQRAIYYGLGVTEHSQGSTTVMAIANLAMATGNIGRRGVGVNPLRGQNNVQGSCDMGSFPHEFPAIARLDDAPRELFEALWGVRSTSRAGPAHPQHVRRRRRRHVQGPLRPGRGHRCSPIPTPSM
jgi:formate dehydrogenase major subunit